MNSRFSIVCNYIDPPDDSATYRYTRETSARSMFRRLVEIERTVNAGGEWEIILYGHGNDGQLVQLDRFSHTDLLQGDGA